MTMDFEQMGRLMQLAQKMDVDRVIKLSEKVDLGELIGLVSQMDEATLAQMTQLMKTRGNGKKHELPPINSDFYGLFSLLPEHQEAVRKKARTFMEEEIRPLVDEYWAREEFPHQIIDKFRTLDLAKEVWGRDGTRVENASVLEGILSMEMARVDVSVSTFYGVHFGLALWSILLGGSDEQKKEWIPRMLDLEVIGAFGLTEPEVGSAVAGGLTMTCRREGDRWILNGRKKWIGNATFADIVVVWAREEETGLVQGFILRTDNPRYQVEKIPNKIALRIVQNGLITLTDCSVPESDRMTNVRSWRTVADVLRATRAGVAWISVGCAMGAYELALDYARKRHQFGKPIASFQLIQNKLAGMLSSLTAMQTMCLRLSQMQDSGQMRDEHASLAKMFAAAQCREIVATARDLFGGNGLLLEYGVARFFSDAEAIYSYEGTNEINALVVGRAITGESAFV